ncbi:energy-coupling factor transporter transmembrane component T [Bacillus wiedmannii]|uniref:energy-coupling factor transporter transmembrane component T n=1 Tax=Bacillus wiedmannii TaxID=1890302 RepID=UPI003D1C9A74
MFDARLQFTLLIIWGFLAISATNTGSLMLAAFAILLLICQNQYRLGFKWFIIYGCLFFAHYFISTYMNASILNVFLLMLLIALKTLPTLIIASGLSKVPSGQLLASLQKLKIPESILLTLTVALRFFPILRTESKIIGENVRIRGISLKSPKNWLRLNQMFEYAIIPLLMRTIRLADDLSASATTRGIDAPCKKTSHYAIAFRPKDSIALLLGLCMFGTLWIS